jgi:surface polysaccharide O-acyltransferase-like enzyme
MQYSDDRSEKNLCVRITTSVIFALQSQPALISIPVTLLVSQFVRLLSILAVLTIHATHTAQMNYRTPETADLVDFIGVFLNQLSRFSVPIFVFLSGYGLAIRFRDGQSLFASAADFYKNRMMRIGIPFIVWTIGLLFLNHRIGWFADLGIAGSLWRSIKTLLWTMWATGADYHFYFFTIILWCYLFFPFLIRIRPGSALNYTVLVLLLLLQLSYLAPSHHFFHDLGIKRPAVPSSFFFAWLFYFYAGITLARKDASTGQTYSNRSILLSALAVSLSFAAVFAEYLYLNNGQDPGNFDHFHRYTVWLYAMSVVWLFRSVNNKLDSFLQGSSGGFLAEAVSYLAGISFTVYIIHTWILRALADLPLFARLGLLSVLSFGGAYILDRLLSRRDIGVVRFLRLALGLPA